MKKLFLIFLTLAAIVGCGENPEENQTGGGINETRNNCELYIPGYDGVQYFYERPVGLPSMSQSVRIKCANATTLNATITSSSNDFTVGSPVAAKANEVAYVTITYSPDPYSANDAVLHITEANSRQIDVPIIIIDLQNQPVPPKTPSNPEWATNLPQGLIISKGGLMAPSGKLENSFAPNEAAWISFYNSFVQNAVNLSVAVGERNASKEARIEIIPQSYYDNLRNFMPNLLQQPLLLFTHDGSYLTITNYNSASAKQQMPLDSTKQYSVFVEYNDESGSHKEVNIPVIFTEQTSDTSTGGESGSENPTPTTPTQPETFDGIEIIPGLLINKTTFSAGEVARLHISKDIAERVENLMLGIKERNETYTGYPFYARAILEGWFYKIAANGHLPKNLDIFTYQDSMLDANMWDFSIDNNSPDLTGKFELDPTKKYSLVVWYCNKNSACNDNRTTWTQEELPIEFLGLLFTAPGEYQNIDYAARIEQTELEDKLSKIDPASDTGVRIDTIRTVTVANEKTEPRELLLYSPSNNGIDTSLYFVGISDDVLPIAAGETKEITLGVEFFESFKKDIYSNYALLLSLPVGDVAKLKAMTDDAEKEKYLQAAIPANTVARIRYKFGIA